MHNNTPDIVRIKRYAKKLSRNSPDVPYMTCLDQAARHLYGVRHYHEAQVRQKRETVIPTPQWYLRTVQEYYLGI